MVLQRNLIVLHGLPALWARALASAAPMSDSIDYQLGAGSIAQLRESCKNLGHNLQLFAGLCAKGPAVSVRLGAASLCPLKRQSTAEPVERALSEQNSCAWLGGRLTSRHDSAQPFSVIQNLARDHSPGRDDVHPVPAFAAQRRGRCCTSAASISATRQCCSNESALVRCLPPKSPENILRYFRSYINQ